VIVDEQDRGRPVASHNAVLAGSGKHAYRAAGRGRASGQGRAHLGRPLPHRQHAYSSRPRPGTRADVADLDNQLPAAAGAQPHVAQLRAGANVTAASAAATMNPTRSLATAVPAAAIAANPPTPTGVCSCRSGVMIVGVDRPSFA